MSTLAATFSLANTATLRQVIKDLNFLLAQTGNPDSTYSYPVVTITADSAGTLDVCRLRQIRAIRPTPRP